MAVLAAVTVSGLSLLDMRCQLDWHKANRISLTGDSGNVLSEYRRLQGYFAHDRYFLYNYAGRLGDLGRYDESLAVARDCSRTWADYYLQLMMADNCMKLQRYDEAEGYFLQAAAMCPARFIPLYQLAKIYMATGRTGEARALASRILDKEIKVPSTVVYAIRHEMRQLIDTTANTTIHQYPSL